jgi:methyltransferase-like protein
MNLKELYDTEITVRINNEDWKLKIEAATHPREHAVIFSLVNSNGEPKHFTLMDKEIFKERDKDTVMKDIIEPVINKLKSREVK